MYRETALSNRLVDFKNGTVLDESDLDLSAEQVFDVVQENTDRVDTFNHDTDGKLEALDGKVTKELDDFESDLTTWKAATETEITNEFNRYEQVTDKKLSDKDKELDAWQSDIEKEIDSDIAGVDSRVNARVDGLSGDFTELDNRLSQGFNELTDDVDAIDSRVDTILGGGKNFRLIARASATISSIPMPHKIHSCMFWRSGVLQEDGADYSIGSGGNSVNLTTPMTTGTKYTVLGNSEELGIYSLDTLSIIENLVKQAETFRNEARQYATNMKLQEVLKT